jgi:hypothetical protein
MNPKKKCMLLRIVMLAGALLLALLVVGIVYAASVTIDTFDEGLQNLAGKPGGPTGSSSTVTVTDGSVLGQHRDAEVQWVSGSGDVYLQIDYADSNKASFSEGSEVTGWTKITWDGDTDPDTLDPDGLGGVDLYGGSPATNDGIRITTVSADHDTIITFTAYSTDTTYYSDMGIRVPGDTSSTRMDLFFPFNSFTSRGSSGGVNWSRLGALVMEIDGRVASDLDITIDFIQANSTREYGDLPVGVYSTTVLSASHIPQGLRLGHDCDTEATYHSSTGADGDDGAEVDDEDGVTPTTLPWCAGSSCGEVTLVIEGCGGACYVNGWIDWNNDGDFGDTVDGASEHIISNYYRTTDAEVARSFATPTSFGNGYYYARFRICKTATACDSPDNTDTNVLNGEIEDYRWALGPTAVTLDSFSAAWQGSQVLVEWTTAQEIDTLGFNLWRSTSLDGDYMQVNEALIPSISPGGVTGGSYSFTDSGVTPGSTYYYKLEELEVGGAHNWYGPAVLAEGGGSNPTAVTLSRFAAIGAAWWPVGALVGVGLAAVWLWRRRRA